MRYIIKVWIPVEEDCQEEYDSLDEALGTLNSLELMQPENHYEIEEVHDEMEHTVFHLL
tara:strand:- start:622 stop:798 length:177 start_codon:yes stop_codon:yes gene_type:complete